MSDCHCGIISNIISYLVSYQKSSKRDLRICLIVVNFLVTLNYWHYYVSSYNNKLNHSNDRWCVF